MNIWFTADTHFDHTNILKYCNRPFKDTEHMNERLIKNWNARVKKEDTVYHLGDFCFKERGERNAQYWEDQLNGKIIVVKGNHDSHNTVKTVLTAALIEIGGKQIMLQHHPVWTPHEVPDFCQMVFCGHVHNKWKFQHITYPPMEGVKEWLTRIPMVNVGVDVWNFMPVDINEIMKEYHRWKNEDDKEG